MKFFPKGSEWRKWDLHVHTPYSIIQGYGQPETAWEHFMADIESLPPEFSVLGINDYIFLDGYQRLLEEREKKGRLRNIDEIFPVIELRIKKFSGTDKFRRINFHVIFSPCLSPKIIQQHFLSALPQRYQLASKYSDIKDEWQALATKESLEELGSLIKRNVPSNQLSKYGSDLQEGFNNINFDENEVRNVLQGSHYFADNYLTAIGKAEWYDIKWNDQSIADKKDVINCVDLVFTASTSPEEFYNSKTYLTNSKVNDRLLDCSDAHFFTNSSEKDRIGHCYTWIKADPTFAGLKRSLLDPDERIYVGLIPPKITDVESQKSHYIQSLEIQKLEKANVDDIWFKNNIPLNPGLIAVIGKKGSGKSALADIIALTGASHIDDNMYPFLCTNKFYKAGLANEYECVLRWCDETTSRKILSEKVDIVAEPERVKYLPQDYMETICNEAGVSDKFQAEINKVVFSYVLKENRLQCQNLEELIGRRSEVINERISSKRSQLSKTIEHVLDLEKKTDPKYSQFLDKKLDDLKKLLVSIKEPPKFEKPDKQLDSLIETRIELLVNQTNYLKEQIEFNEKKLEEINSKLTTLENLKGKFNLFLEQKEKLKSSIETELKIFDLDFDNLLKVQLDLTQLENIQSQLQDQQKEISDLLKSEESFFEDTIEIPIGLRYELKIVRTVRESIKNTLDRKGRDYQEYLHQLALLKEKRDKIVGRNTDKSLMTIKSIEMERSYLKDKLSADLKKAYSNLETEVSDLFNLISEKRDIYQDIYKPLMDFIAIERERQIRAESVLEFDVRVVFDKESLVSNFVSFIDHRRSGYFSGLKEGPKRFRNVVDKYELQMADSCVRMITEIIQLLKSGEGNTTYLIKDQVISDKAGRSTDFDLYNLLYGLYYIDVKYTILFNNKDLNSNVFSPGEKGAILLIFYLLIDKEKCPLIIDQPEENLDNESVVDLLVPYIRKAKLNRQIMIITHNPNLAVVCDAEQVIHTTMDKTMNKIRYRSGSIEHPDTNKLIVDVLEGTMPAFRRRDNSYMNSL